MQGTICRKINSEVTDMLIVTIPEITRMPAFEAWAHEEDDSVEVRAKDLRVRLTDKLSKPEQILARLMLSLGLRLQSR